MTGRMNQSNDPLSRAERGSGPVWPIRSRRGLAGLGLVLLALLLVGSVYLSILRVRYGEEIQSLRQSVMVLGSEVRDLEGQKATRTSLASIEEKAKEMGMMYPRNAPRTLVVQVPPGEVPPTWSTHTPWDNPDRTPPVPSPTLTMLRDRSGGKR